MSHQVVLAERTARGWSGVHIQWGLPAWVLPVLHDRIQARIPTPDVADASPAQAPTAAMEDLVASDIRGPRTGYYRYPATPQRKGDGRVGSRQTRWGISHELVYVLDPQTRTVEMLTRGRCPTHAPVLDAHEAALGDRGTFPELGTCPWGVVDERTERGGIRHPHHRLPRCGCVCAGWRVATWTSVLRYDVADGRVPALFAVLEQDGLSTEDDVAFIRDLLAGPAAAPELYLAMRRNGGSHDLAAEAAGLAYAAPA